MRRRRRRLVREFPPFVAENHVHFGESEILHGFRSEKLRRRRVSNASQEGEQWPDVALYDVVPVGFRQRIQAVGGKGGSHLDFSVQTPSSERMVEVFDRRQNQTEVMLLVSTAEDGGADDDRGYVGGRVVSEDVVSQPTFGGENAAGNVIQMLGFHVDGGGRRPESGELQRLLTFGCRGEEELDLSKMVNSRAIKIKEGKNKRERERALPVKQRRR